MVCFETLECTLRSSNQAVSSPRMLQQWIQDWKVPMEALGEIPEPYELPYGRKSLFHSDAMDVVLVHLPPGTQTWIHDHGRSVGCAVVLEGRLSNRIFTLDTYGFPQLQKEYSLAAGECLLAPKRQIHQMHNAGPDRTVSLHIYSPALKDTRKFREYEDALDFVI
ncbi:cysteine dioxygenase family protein [Paenibacillus filicis]|uniref:Cysteine dioxygenase family protein n=1 Tax=Paenibacillus filicis TaxID=669464 RepID=A0ABU9DFX3_9BACL